MTCPGRDQIVDQAGAITLDPWFTIHLLVCDECRLRFEISRITREVSAELQAESDDIWEPLDPQPRDWMLWMMPEGLLYPGTSH